MRNWPRLVSIVSLVAVALLVLIGGPRESAVSAPNGAGVTEAVRQGCLAREESPWAIEFTVTADRFEGARGLSFFASELGLAASSEEVVERFTGGDQGSRSRFIEHHRITPDEWEIEAQARYWGGADSLFVADLSRDPTDLGGLHMKRLSRPGLELQYCADPTNKRPMGRAVVPMSPWDVRYSAPAGYLGLTIDPLGAPSKLLGELIDAGATVSYEAVEHEGHEGIVLTLRSEPVEGAHHLFHLGFVKLNGYAPFMAETTHILRAEDDRESIRRIFAEWSGYVEGPNGLWIATRFRQSSFSTDNEGRMRLSSGCDATIDPPSITSPAGRLADDALADWFPVGTTTTVSQDVIEQLGPAVEAEITHRTLLMGLHPDWVKAPLKDLVYHMDEPLLNGTDAERAAAMAQLRAEVMQEETAPQ